MFKWSLVTVVIVPVLLGMWTAAGRRKGNGLLLLGLVFAYDVFYLVVFYYVRIRWGG